MDSPVRIVVVVEFTRLQWLSLAFCNLSTKRQIRYAKKAKRRGIMEFISFSASSLLASKIFTMGKILQLYADQRARWPLCKLWEHRFLVPDLFSSRHPPAPVVTIPILRANDLIKDGWRRRGRNLRSNQRKSPASKFVFVALFCRTWIFSLGRHCFGTKERNTIGKLYPCFVY